MQVGQASKEVRISEQGQITDRFNAAIGNLGSQSPDIRMGGIFALQRIMQDSVRDQPAVVSVLSAFARQHAGSSTASLKEPLGDRLESPTPKPDIEAAIGTLARRKPGGDAGVIIDLSKSNLRGLHFAKKPAIRLPGVILSEADLRNAVLPGADLRNAFLEMAHLDRAFLQEANLQGALLLGANFTHADLSRANLRGVKYTCPFQPTKGLKCLDLQYADLFEADLRNAKLSGVSLHKANLLGADLRGADLHRADLTGADFSDAKLAGVDLGEAKRAGAIGLPEESYSVR
ncbi:pentapeptide repeat-containing protein [Streptomyces sp. NPDC057681]|uniref:pentapeptide repeat-containing protein n=1 Tax=unclassified Streptomyces TaxID=2593676 RepID=UPI0036821726